MQTRGVLLDVDGTLVDSNDAHASAWVEALAENGFAVPFEKVRRLIGMGGDKLLPAVAGVEEDSPKGKAISRRRGDLFREKYLPHLNAMPGARSLVQRLRGAGLKLAVASSAKEDELGGLLKAAGVDDLVGERTSSDDADRSKPDPDIIHAALTRVGLKPGTAVLVGDTPYDVEAGLRGGVRVVALRCGGWEDEDLQGASAIYDDPAALVAHFESSPLAGSG
jgi:HAD superfamily hydrolase (TIGR01509 family)